MKKKSQLPEKSFDSVARSYEKLHDSNLRFSGETSEDFVLHKAQLISEFLRTRKLTNEPLQFLDLGCGTGRMSVPLTATHAKLSYVGADISSASLEVARERNTPRSRFVEQLKPAALPAEDQSFDLVLTACVLHHVAPIHRTALAAEIFRVLKPHGRWIIFEHNPWNPLTQYIVKTCEFDDDAILLTARETNTLALNSGFSIELRDYVLFFPKALRTRAPWLEKSLGWLPFGAQYWAVAQRPGLQKNKGL